MNVSLTPELEKFVSAKVGSGRYNSASEVVREALRLLEEHDSARAAQLTDFNGELGRRLAALDRGETVDPAEARARSRRKSAERRKPGGFNRCRRCRRCLPLDQKAVQKRSPVEIVAVTQGFRDIPAFRAAGFAIELFHRGCFWVAATYVVETIPLDGCTAIGDNDIGLNRSEFGIRNAEAHQKSGLRAHCLEASGDECAGQFECQGDR